VLPSEVIEEVNDSLLGYGVDIECEVFVDKRKTINTTNTKASAAVMNAYVGCRILDKRKTINTTNTKASAAMMNAYTSCCILDKRKTINTTNTKASAAMMNAYASCCILDKRKTINNFLELALFYGSMNRKIPHARDLSMRDIY